MPGGPIIQLIVNPDPLVLAARIQARAELMEERMKEAGDPLAREARDTMRIYPPERPGQKYKRTYELRKNWAWRSWPIIHGRTYSVYNHTPYAPYVQGAVQAWMHVDRWILLEVVMEKMQQRLHDIVAALVEQFTSGE